jgi:DNA-binding Xre family transcriptional regulator
MRIPKGVKFGDLACLATRLYQSLVLLSIYGIVRAVAIRWKVKEFLADNQITPYRLKMESGLAQGTVYRLANNEATAVNAETIDVVVRSLRRLTGKPINVCDLLEYTE